MGRAYKFHCSHCGCDFRVSLGYGFRRATLVNETLSAIRAGDYGEKWQSLLAAGPYNCVDVSRCLYVCPSCGAWKTEHSLNLYVANDHFRRDPSVPLRVYPHRCDRCRTRMRRTEPSQLNCPECGQPCEVDLSHGQILWD